MMKTKLEPTHAAKIPNELHQVALASIDATETISAGAGVVHAIAAAGAIYVAPYKALIKFCAENVDNDIDVLLCLYAEEHWDTIRSNFPELPPECYPIGV